jgi:hypothetical protein
MNPMSPLSDVSTLTSDDTAIYHPRKRDGTKSANKRSLVSTPEDELKV